MSPNDGKTPLVGRVTDLCARLGLRAGDRLPAEVELCRMLDVSRPALREALSALEAAGMLASRKGSGRILLPVDFGRALTSLGNLIPMTNKRLLDLLFVRQLLEVNMLPVAVPRMTAQTMAELGEITERIEAKARNGEFFAVEDHLFHRLLYRGLENEVLDGVLDLFWDAFNRLDPSRMSHSQRLDETAAHHRRIHDSIEQGDVRKAQYHLDAHFYDTAFAVSRYENAAHATL